MIKHILLIIILSVLIIISMPHVHTALTVLLRAHDWVADALKDIFSGGQAGSIIRELLGLLAIPFAIGLVPASLFWLIKRRWMPYFIHFVWVTWLIQTSALVALFSATTHTLAA